jgi:hypothetical protein
MRRGREDVLAFSHVVSLEDFIQDGCIGLLKAIDTFDRKMGATFKSHAYWKIYGALSASYAKARRFAGKFPKGVEGSRTYPGAPGHSLKIMGESVFGDAVVDSCGNCITNGVTANTFIAAADVALDSDMFRELAGEVLSPRECEFLDHRRMGMTCRDIGVRHGGLSVSTVSFMFTVMRHTLIKALYNPAFRVQCALRRNEDDQLQARFNVLNDRKNARKRSDRRNAKEMGVAT